MKTSRMRAFLVSGLALLVAIGLPACASAGASTAQVTPTTPPTATATTAPTATATPLPQCAVMLQGGSPSPFTVVSGAPGLKMPAGTYITTGGNSGGGAGEYKVASYTLCFPGTESQIDGGSSSTISKLAASGWTVNNLFPDPSSLSYLDYCSGPHNCLNTSGSPGPFSFVGFDQYVNHPGNYTTFRMQVALINPPSCLNDPSYYSGTPKYTLYYDGNKVNAPANPQNHFQMPPGTRVSTFQGGGTAGSTYVYFCSAGTQASVVNFLEQSMANVGWAVSGASASGFTATIGSSPNMYTIAVTVQNPNNYYLRVFVPM